MNSESTYLREFVYSHAIASSHAHSDDSTCRTPSRILAIHTCTFVRFLRIDDAGACAVAPPGWGQTSTLGTADAGPKSRQRRANTQWPGGRREWGILAGGSLPDYHEARR